ncbi:MAG: glycosyltransferase family 2 protein [Pseudobdellovibrionaceae bacterium]|jgi:glycosyltransferase involved in cell wall biosynthesis|nr:glycosyltransferase family 2 protein [Pseudobdellovibrionaceae bacterium]
MSQGQIPVTVIVVTKNEGQRIEACLRSVQDFDEILVVDSHSRDQTGDIARACGVDVITFTWNGQYPKKRQWCLDNLPLKHDWVFFLDADEIFTPELIEEIRHLFSSSMPQECGFFVTGRYSVGGKVLRFGLPNKKIALFDRARMGFPVVDDLDIPGMGEIEGHYQPVCLRNDLRIGSLQSYLVHYALEDERAWAFRHEKYAAWEAGMNKKGAWPIDPVHWRQCVKSLLRGSRFRPEILFLVGFILKLGFLDGKYGHKLAIGKYKYYKYIKYIT